MSTSSPLVLLDCDGVIVDNRQFERQVTDVVTQAVAKKMGVPVAEARTIWNQDLKDTKGSPYWYDYTYHCNRLGVDGESVVRQAHESAQKLLSVVQGARQTLAMLESHNFSIGIVTDATRWVVEFKLNTLGIKVPATIFASSDAKTTKASPIYWERFSQFAPGMRPAIFVDNRQVNLISARSVFPALSLVRFEMDEHVTTLSASIAPRSDLATNSALPTVHNHAQLRAWFLSDQPEIQPELAI